MFESGIEIIRNYCNPLTLLAPLGGEKLPSTNSFACRPKMQYIMYTCTFRPLSKDISMTFLTNPRFEHARSMWDRFWADEPLPRPLVVASVVDHVKRQDRNIWYGYQQAMEGRYGEALDHIDNALACTEYFGEAVPFFSPDHGPDQFAAFLGADFHSARDTTWASPVVADWEKFLPFALKEDNPIWKSYLAFSRALAGHSQGRYVVGMADLHSNIDTLAALRGPQQLCMDLYECPELIERATVQARALFPVIYNRIFTAGGMENSGSVGWIPFWCQGKYASIQADFICMVSPDMARRFIIPALEEEATFLDHCIYHLDGPGALAHLDDLLSITCLDAIQWIPGAGQPPQWEWIEILQKCQKAGKKLQLLDVPSLEVVKLLHKNLEPKGLVYCLSGMGREDILRVIEWIEKNPKF